MSVHRLNSTGRGEKKVSRRTGTVQAPAPGSYGNIIGGRLKNFGFNVKRDISFSPYRIELTAVKTGLDTQVQVFGKIRSIIAVTAMDTVSSENVVEYSRRITRYAKDSGETPLFRITVIFPVIVTGDTDAKLKTWLQKPLMDTHSTLWEFPVIASGKNREIFP
jgi:hypothetical protein